MAAAQIPGAPGLAKATPLEIVLVEAPVVRPATVLQWKKERFQAVAVVLNERTDKAAYREVARHISDGGLDLYWWIEVARNPKLATVHPRWMAALGSHTWEAVSAVDTSFSCTLFTSVMVSFGVMGAANESANAAIGTCSSNDIGADGNISRTFAPALIFGMTLRG